MRVGGAASEDHDASLFHMANGTAPDIRFGNLVYRDGGHASRRNAGLFERVLQGKSVDHGCKHAHLVRRHAVHFLSGCRNAAEEIPATDHEADLEAGSCDFGYLGREIVDTFGTDA